VTPRSGRGLAEQTARERPRPTPEYRPSQHAAGAPTRCWCSTPRSAVHRTGIEALYRRFAGKGAPDAVYGNRPMLLRKHRPKPNGGLASTLQWERASASSAIPISVSSGLFDATRTCWQSVGYSAGIIEPWEHYDPLAEIRRTGPPRCTFGRPNIVCVDRGLIRNRPSISAPILLAGETLQAKNFPGS